MDDPYQLQRFVAAQDTGGTYQRAVEELRAGAKRGHWMWFVFPQIAGLGFSAMSKRYAIASLTEAKAYLAHPVLGPRIEECARILIGTQGRSATDVFGDVDAMKLRSSMTLFATAAPDVPAFGTVIGKYFDGEPDEATLELLPLPGRQVVAVCPRGDVAAVDREREQLGEGIRGAGERGDAEPRQRRSVVRVIGRRTVVGQREQGHDRDSGVPQR